MALEVEINKPALFAFVNGTPQARQLFKRIGEIVRDEARANVPENLKGHREANPEKAIVAIVGTDVEGVYVDVGYDKKHPGFYLWWHEVGTQDNPAQPHLRPALRPGILDGLSMDSVTDSAASELVDYTTQAGVTRQATRAQVANWTRGSRTP